jgi:hypothetical protein
MEDYSKIKIGGHVTGIMGLSAVLTEKGVAAEIEHVSDPHEIASYVLSATPVLIINGKVKSTGSVPPRIRLEAWLARDAE